MLYHMSSRDCRAVFNMVVYTARALLGALHLATPLPPLHVCCGADYVCSTVYNRACGGVLHWAQCRFMYAVYTSNMNRPIYIMSITFDYQADDWHCLCIHMRLDSAVSVCS